MDLKRIQELQEDFIQKESFNNSHRDIALSKLSNLDSLLKKEVDAYKSMHELDEYNTLVLIRLIAIQETISEIWQNVLNLDNYRIEQIELVIQMLRNADIKLNEELDKYGQW